jgi:tight adherence protein B
MSFIGIFIAVLVGLAIMALFAGLLVIFSRQDPNERLQDFIQPEFVANTEGDQATNTGSASKAVFKKLDRQLQSRGIGGKINADLLQADLKLTVSEYILLVLGVTALGALIGFLISRQPISAFVAGAICFFGPGIIVKTRQIKRRRTFASQLVDVLTQIIGSLRSGYGLLQALDLAAAQVPPPAGEEFGRVVREVQLGQPLMVALRHLAERIDNDDLVIIIAAINTSQQVGGNLAEILDIVSETIRERVRIKQEIQVLTAQQTISGYVLVFLPIALGALLMIINPTYQMRLFTPGITLCIPGGAGLGIILGFILMRRIVNIEV